MIRALFIAAMVAFAAFPVSAQDTATAVVATETFQIADMTLGNPDATVTVVEYASFTCPHCATFHSGPFKELQEEYIDTGKIKFIYR